MTAIHRRAQQVHVMSPTDDEAMMEHIKELLAEVGWDGLIVLCLQQQDVGLQVLNPLVRAVKGD